MLHQIELMPPYLSPDIKERIELSILYGVKLVLSVTRTPVRNFICYFQVEIKM